MFIHYYFYRSLYRRLSSEGDICAILCKEFLPLFHDAMMKPKEEESKSFFSVKAARSSAA